MLLITLDTTRTDHLGCFGGTTAQTPNLDRLAREGTIFTRCTTCSPLTLPSHSSIMTGLYPYAHGARQNGIGRLATANLTLAEVLKAAGFTTQATVAAFVLNREFGIDQGFEVYHDVVPPTTGESPLSAERKGDEVCDDAIGMLSELATGGRFFLWVHFYDPHYPYESKRIQDPFSPIAYADEVTFMDAQIGRLMEHLKRLGREADTLVVVVSDHGEGLGEHDELTHGYLLYEPTVHVPLLMRCPGIIPAGKAVSAQVGTIDIAPTILELMGCAPLESAQGVSLVPLLDGRQTDLKLSIYSETFDAQIEYGLSQLRSLSTGRWKYILAPTPELYDLPADPRETRNLAGQQPELASELRRQLRQLIADAPPPPPPDQTTAGPTGEVVRQLESLGYVGQPVRFTEEGVTELDRFEPVGGDPKDCAHLFRLMAREFPQMISSGQFAQAESLLRQMIQAMPNTPRLRTHLARVLNSQGRTEEATQAFQEAVRLAPDDPDVRRKYGTFLSRVGRYQEALEQFDWVLSRLPNDTFTLEEAARALEAMGKLELAEQRVRIGLEIEPRSARLLWFLGNLVRQQGRLSEAIQHYRAALEIDPGFKECQRSLNQAEQELGP